jgi:hypothetical protein
MATEPKNPKKDEKDPELSNEDLDGVSGGFNPQPDPPGRQASTQIMTPGVTKFIKEVDPSPAK